MAEVNSVKVTTASEICEIDGSVTESLDEINKKKMKEHANDHSNGIALLHENTYTYQRLQKLYLNISQQPLTSAKKVVEGSNGLEKIKDNTELNLKESFSGLNLVGERHASSSSAPWGAKSESENLLSKARVDISVGQVKGLPGQVDPLAGQKKGLLRPVENSIGLNTGLSRPIDSSAIQNMGLSRPIDSSAIQNMGLSRPIDSSAVQNMGLSRPIDSSAVQNMGLPQPVDTLSGQNIGLTKQAALELKFGNADKPAIVPAKTDFNIVSVDNENITKNIKVDSPDSDVANNEYVAIPNQTRSLINELHSGKKDMAEVKGSDSARMSHLPQMQENMTVSNNNKLTYTFSEWGKGHQVNIHLAQSNASPLVLHPSDSIVQQRLSDHGGEHNQKQPEWVFSEDADKSNDGRQKFQHNQQDEDAE